MSDILPAGIEPRQLAGFYMEKRKRLMGDPERLPPKIEEPIELIPPIDENSIKDELERQRWHSLVPQPITIASPYPSIKSIVRTVSHYYNVPIRHILHASKKANYALPRQVCYYIAHKELSPNRNSLVFIGKQLGNRDHSTVSYGIKRIMGMIAADERFAAEVDVIREMVRGHAQAR